jgi:hypothetical protein
MLKPKQLVCSIIFFVMWQPSFAFSQVLDSAIKYEPVDDSFRFTLYESLEQLPPRSPRERAPSIFIGPSTVRTFSCLLPLGVQAETRGRLVVVQILGIPRGPRICPAAVGPATGRTVLPIGVGQYDLIIRRPDGLLDKYLLSVADSVLEVRVKRAQFTTLTPKRRWRARRNTMMMTCTLPWVVNSVDSSQSWVCTNFIGWLQDSLSMERFQFDSGAALPFLTKDPKDPQQWDEPVYFHYREPEDFRRAYVLLQRFSHRMMAKRAPNAFIAIFSWRGADGSSYRCRATQHWCEPSDSVPAW